MVKNLVPGGTFLLNTPLLQGRDLGAAAHAGAADAASPRRRKFYVIDATKVARDSGMGGRINTIMQVCFFALSGVLPKDEAIEAIKYSIKKTYGKKGEEIVADEPQGRGQHAGASARGAADRAKVNGTGGLLPPVTPNAPDVRPATCSASSPPAAATNCPSAPSRATAPSRPPPRNTRSAIWRSTSRFGTRRFASSA